MGTETLNHKEFANFTRTGKIKSTDKKSSLDFRFGLADNRVVVAFSQQIGWIGLPPDAAIQFAKNLVELAGQAKGKKLRMRISHGD